jgi:hypothetical protein
MMRQESRPTIKTQKSYSYKRAKLVNCGQFSVQIVNKYPKTREYRISKPFLASYTSTFYIQHSIFDINLIQEKTACRQPFLYLSRERLFIPLSFL